VAVRGRAPEDRPAEVEPIHDRGGPHIEHLSHHRLELRRIDLRRAERLDHDRHRVGDTDCVRDLGFAPLGQPGRDDCLRDLADCVRGRAVDLRGVLARERAATMARHSAIRVDDDLAAGEPGVGVGAAELEQPGGVHEDLEVVAGELFRQRGSDHVLDQRGLDVFLDADAGSVLGGDEHRVEADGNAVFVLDRHLGLAVGPQEVDHVVFANLGEPLGHAVRKPDRHRHERVGLVARVAEHHSLVARAHFVVRIGVALALLHRLVDTHRDVGRLFVDGDDDAAGLAVDAERGVGVADAVDRVAGDARDVDVRLRADLTGDHAQAGGHEGLARHPPVRILREDCVEDAVADRVGHLVRVALGDRLGRERVPAQRTPPLRVSREMLGGRVAGIPKRRIDQLGDAFEEPFGQRVFREQRKLLDRTAGVEDDRAVGVDLEPESDALTSLATMRSTRLAASFDAACSRSRSVSAANPTMT
jgi:hypothetical protein